MGGYRAKGEGHCERDRAKEALALADIPVSRGSFIAAVRKEYPRAYEPWKPEEDESLRELFEQGCVVTEIAYRLQRRDGAIEARLRKLGLDTAQRVRVSE